MYTQNKDSRHDNELRNSVLRLAKECLHKRTFLQAHSHGLTWLQADSSRAVPLTQDRVRNNNKLYTSTNYYYSQFYHEIKQSTNE
jgi:hypothetical protein